MRKVTVSLAKFWQESNKLVNTTQLCIVIFKGLLTPSENGSKSEKDQTTSEKRSKNKRQTSKKNFSLSLPHSVMDFSMAPRVENPGSATVKVNSM